MYLSGIEAVSPHPAQKTRILGQQKDRQNHARRCQNRRDAPNAHAQIVFARQNFASEEPIKEMPNEQRKWIFAQTLAQV